MIVQQIKLLTHEMLQVVGKTSVFLLHFTDGEKECTPHCFSPPYGPVKSVQFLHKVGYLLSGTTRDLCQLSAAILCEVLSTKLYNETLASYPGSFL